jgi:hypothetical protein
MARNAIDSLLIAHRETVKGLYLDAIAAVRAGNHHGESEKITFPKPEGFDEAGYAGNWYDLLLEEIAVFGDDYGSYMMSDDKDDIIQIELVDSYGDDDETPCIWVNWDYYANGEGLDGGGF